MRRRLRRWRPALRIARRDALRARGRSTLIIVMIALPILAIVALDTLGRTAEVTTVEGLDRHLGHADALVTFQGQTEPVDQDPTMNTFGTLAPIEGAKPVTLPAPTARTIAGVLPAGSHVVELGQGDVTVETKVGLSRPGGFEIDLRRPVAQGLFDLTDGRLPRARDEVVISSRLAKRGFEPGALMTFAGGHRARVVGLVESTTSRDANAVVGLPGSLHLEHPEAAPDLSPSRSWLVTAPGGVSWTQVRALNQQALYALSREVIENPPPKSQVTMSSFNGTTVGASEIATLAMIVAMALLEVVLLAGPAFAVGVRRQQRSLALLAATGGEAADVRRVVLASGIVLGSVSGVVGMVGGIGAAWLARPAIQQFSTERFGPFQVMPREVIGIAACALLSALLAALAPAITASRQDVVAVLAGRRGQTKRPVWSPVFGTLLLSLGVAGAVYGARQVSGGEFLIAGAAISSVLGMVLLIPLVVAQLAHLARVLPMPLRFAMRDAARQRSRTAPAVAAVAAVVAGVVTLGIGASSDAAQNRATYSPSAPMGAAVVSSFDTSAKEGRPWARIREAVRQQLPAAHISDVRGVPDELPISDDPQAPVEQLTIEPVADAPETNEEGSFVSYSSSYGASVLVGAASLDALVLDISAADASRAHALLAEGGVVLLGNSASDVTAATVRTLRLPTKEGQEPTETGRWTVPAAVVRVSGPTLPAQSVMSDAAARTAGVPVVTTALLVDGTPVRKSSEDALSEALNAIGPQAQVYVERGFHDNSTAVALLLLGVVGGVLVLGGTLTATFLALSDARPDFATMSAVGAAPRTRRMVAASYALAVGAVGAVLGAAVGFVPGIAVTYPLTSTSGGGSTDSTGTLLPDHFLDVPWLLVLGVVVGLPLLTAAFVGLTSRSRLPMVSRLS